MLLDLPTAARYNRWANARIYKACQLLKADELALDRKGFFGSILGTLNHIPVSYTHLTLPTNREV